MVYFFGPEPPDIVVVCLALELGVEVLPGSGIEAGSSIGQGHLILPLESALEGRARLEELQPHIHAGTPVLLLHHREVSGQSLRAISDGEAGRFSPFVHQNTVGM